MPELPEVETIVRELQTCDLVGHPISRVEVFWPGSVATPDVATFSRRLVGQTIEKVSRRGKFIVFTLSQDFLLIHLRMTGKLVFNQKTTHERLRLQLSDGRSLRFEDQRKFGKWYLVSSPTLILDLLGVEPLSADFTLEVFEEILSRVSRPLKPFLLDQTHIVGLGNIYVDEALWVARLHPLRKTHSLSLDERSTLHQAIIHVLQTGVDHSGTSLGTHQSNYYSVSGRRGGHQTHLHVFRRQGEVCSICGTTILKITVAQRGTHYCPLCQQENR